MATDTAKASTSDEDDPTPNFVDDEDEHCGTTAGSAVEDETMT